MPSLWKQEAALHPTFAPLNRCLAEDWFLLPFELRLQRAHGEALRAAGIYTDDELAAVRGALDGIEREFSAAGCPESDAEDIHTWIEQQLTERAGAAGKKIHTARSRNDQVATLLRMYAIAAAERLDGRVRALVEVSCQKAQGWAELAFPLHTHQQFAAPGSVGFWMLRFAVAWSRVREQLAWHTDQWRRSCPLGSAGGAGSSIEIDRRIQASVLGFAEPSLNALDSTSTRDECLELLATLTQLGLHMQSFATDVIVFSQTSLAWTKYPKGFATGSSMMPNKVNPDAMELLRGRCNALAAAHGELVGILKGLPSGYNRDLQCAKPLVHAAVENAEALLAMLTAFVAELDFDAERLSASLAQGHIDATLRMEGRVRAGMALREAHHAVAAEVSGDSQAAPRATAVSLDSYRTQGGSSPKEVRRVARLLLDAAGPPIAPAQGR